MTRQELDKKYPGPEFHRVLCLPSEVKHVQTWKHTTYVTHIIEETKDINGKPYKRARVVMKS